MCIRDRHPRAAMEKTATPNSRIGFRPYRSDRGPKIIGPIEKPRRNRVSVWVAAAVLIPNSEARPGRPGRPASVPKGGSADSKPSMTT